MTTELTILAWTLVLAVLQIILHASVRNKETGLAYNMGARDGTPPPEGKLSARLHRAQINLYESLPLFAAAILLVHVAGRESELTLRGAQLYLAARVIYVPLYAAGTPVLRSLVWGASVAGLGMVLFAVLR